MKLGNTIKRLRKDRNINQVNLAKTCSISQTYLSQIENDERNPTIAILEKISIELNVPLAVISFLSLTIDSVPEDKKETFRQNKGAMFGLVEGVFLRE